MTERKKTILYAVAVFLLAAMTYLPTVRYAFVPLDDHEYVIRNPHVHKGLTLESVKWAITAIRYDGACEWHPLAWISEMFDISVSGAAKMSDAEWDSSKNVASAAIHFHNALLHAANASLVFLLLLLLSRHPAVRRGAAVPVDQVWLFALTLLWALHPLRTEVVCWAAERKELTCTFFMLLTLMAYFRARYVLAFVLCVLAMAAKPMAVTLPVILLAWDWAFGGKVRILRSLPFFALSAATCFLTVCSQEEALEAGRTMTVAERLTTIFGSPVRYLFQTVWPVDLSVYYWTVPGFDWPVFAPGVVLAALVFALGVWWTVRRLGDAAWRNAVADVGVFAIGWCYVCLSPMLLLGNEQHCDRYTYWSGIGLFAALTMLMASRGHAWRKAAVAWAGKVDGKPFDWSLCRRNILLTLGAVVVILTVATERQMTVWRQPRVFMQRAVSKCWGSGLANVFATWILRENPGALDEAEYWLRECANRNPGVESHVNLARFLLRMRPLAVTTFSGEACTSEPEILLRQVLSAAPENKVAKDLMKELEALKAKAGGTK